MHLGFDAKRLFNNFTGLGNYSRTLLRNLAEYSPDSAFFLFSPKAEQHEETTFFFHNPTFQIISPSGIRKAGWRSKGMIRDLKKQSIDLYHGLSHELPRGIEKSGISTVVTIHDLIYRHYPKQYKRFDNFIYDQKFSHACQKADMVVAISESTKRDIQHFFGTAEEKIKVIYQSCDERFLLDRPPSIRQEVLDKYELPANFSLYVGSLIPRKNLMGIVEAIAQLPDDLKHPLVIIGGGGAAYKKAVCAKAQQLGVADLLYFKSVSFADLPVLYQSAQVFLYPSRYEGFGIPVIEALNSGTPVITSNKSSLPEAAGPDSLLVDPDRTDAIAKAWIAALTDNELRKNMISKGRKYAERFRAEQVTPAMLALYKSILER